MYIAASIFALLAALLHIYIFYLEAFAWDKPSARKVFGPLSKEELDATRFMAYNQGVYNLMLAIVTIAGLLLSSTALILAGVLSMIGAAAALAFKSSAHRGAAAKQSFLAILATIFIILT